MNPNYPYHFHSLGDSAILIHFDAPSGKELSEHILALYEAIKEQQFSFITDVVPAYDTLTVFYSFQEVTKLKTTTGTAFDYACNIIEKIIGGLQTQSESLSTNVIRIPVCYEAPFAPDLERLAHDKQLSIPEVIQEHSNRLYRVYMIGFLPGFPYMGEISDAITAARKKSPQPVVAGSVGIAGTQTGIYPLDSPGGWQIIGRTPMKMFDAAKTKPVLLQPGDTVQFYPITAHEYTNY